MTTCSIILTCKECYQHYVIFIASLCAEFEHEGIGVDSIMMLLHHDHFGISISQLLNEEPGEDRIGIIL